MVQNLHFLSHTHRKVEPIILNFFSREKLLKSDNQVSKNGGVCMNIVVSFVVLTMFVQNFPLTSLPFAFLFVQNFFILCIFFISTTVFGIIISTTCTILFLNFSHCCILLIVDTSVWSSPLFWYNHKRSSNLLLLPVPKFFPYLNTLFGSSLLSVRYIFVCHKP